MQWFITKNMLMSVHHSHINSMWISCFLCPIRGKQKVQFSQLSIWQKEKMRAIGDEEPWLAWPSIPYPQWHSPSQIGPAYSICNSGECCMQFCKHLWCKHFQQIAETLTAALCVDSCELLKALSAKCWNISAICWNWKIISCVVRHTVLWMLLFRRKHCASSKSGLWSCPENSNLILELSSLEAIFMLHQMSLILA